MPDELGEERWREYYVRPRYLAGSGEIGDPGFEPVAHWPHHDLGDGPCQLLVTSPDYRIRIGWFGDDAEPWEITASENPVSSWRWTAVFSDTFPPEIVAGFTTALAKDGDAGRDHFLDRPSTHWAEKVQPLLDAGWQHIQADHGIIDLETPDQQAGAQIARSRYSPNEGTTTLWAGPAGWERAEAVFSSDVPAHLISATAAAMVDPAPLVRERHMIPRRVQDLVQLDPVDAKTPDTQSASRAPTPLDAKRAAVTAALDRAAHGQDETARAAAARIRTTTPATPITRSVGWDVQQLLPSVAAQACASSVRA